jgi:cytidylate kinase
MAKPAIVIVAIDGGAASGKSSTARGVVERLGLLHVDTGSHYRFVTHRLLIAGIRPDDAAQVEAGLSRMRPGTRIAGSQARITLDGCEPGEEIRSAEVNAAVSSFAALPPVRQFLLGYQRSQAEVAREAGFPGLVMEGRDIGTVIFPEAQVKIFLTADPEARARRRALEGQEDSILLRDRADSLRRTAPLAQASDAEVIDSTHLSLAEVVERVCARVTRLMGRH